MTKKVKEWMHTRGASMWILLYIAVVLTAFFITFLSGH